MGEGRSRSDERCRGESEALKRIILSHHFPGNGFRSEHGKSLIDFIHSDGLFALLEFSNKAQAKSGPECKLLLG